MKLACAIAASILVLGISPAEAQDSGTTLTTSKVLNDFRGDTEFKKNVMSVAINVAMNSFTVMNAELQYMGRPQLYCQPVRVSHEIEQLVRMMEAEVAKDPQMASVLFQFALLFALMSAYPCGDAEKN